MCGRFTLRVSPEQIADLFSIEQMPPLAARYNIAPTQPVLAIRDSYAGNGREATFLNWGLIPSWATDPSIGSRMINARAETAAEKPSFRAAFKYQRCIIPADGFYEWKAAPGRKIKTPYFIHMKDRKPFAFAGLWDSWESPDGSSLKTCTIITTEPNELMATIHNRMPVILPPRDYAKWLDASPQTPENLLPLLKPYPADAMSAHPVSTLVNKPENDSSELVVPA